jgi:hypothetical protein
MNRLGTAGGSDDCITPISNRSAMESPAGSDANRTAQILFEIGTAWGQKTAILL